MARPAITTVFVAFGQPKDDFNAFHRQWERKTNLFFQSDYWQNPAYTTNALDKLPRSLQVFA
jgi:hypothetical protein